MRRFFARLVNLFRGPRAESELAREIESHLALLEDDFERRGLSPEAARGPRAAPTAASSKPRNCIARRVPSSGSSNCSRMYATAGGTCCARQALRL